jgi:transketolase C-terminal domain/subunit
LAHGPRLIIGAFWNLIHTKGTFIMSQRAEYITKMETQLEKLNVKMNSLEAGAQEAKDEARLKYKEEMGKLRQQSKVAIAKLEELKTSSEDTWETMVTDMEKMHDAFTHSFFSFFQVPKTSGAEEKSSKAEQSDAHKKP